VVLAVVIDASEKSAAVERVGNIERRLKTCAYGVHVKDSAAKGHGAFRRQTTVENVKQIAVCSLVVNTIVAITRR